MKIRLGHLLDQNSTLAMVAIQELVVCRAGFRR